MALIASQHIKLSHFLSGRIGANLKFDQFWDTYYLSLKKEAMKFRKSFSSFNWEMEVGKNVHFWWELPWCQKISGILDNSWIILGRFEDNVNLCAFESLFHILHRILVVLSHHASFNPSIKSRKYCLPKLLAFAFRSENWLASMNIRCYENTIL